MDEVSGGDGIVFQRSVRVSRSLVGSTGAWINTVHVPYAYGRITVSFLVVERWLNWRMHDRDQYNTTFSVADAIMTSCRSCR